jgi:hypothetical protein
LGGGGHGGRGKENRSTLLSSSASVLGYHLTMSRRAAIVEVEEFDDDTDLPLPSRSLPDTGTRGAILEEIVHSDDDGEDSDEAPDLLHHSAMSGPALQPSARDTRVTDITPYKKYAQPQSQT